MKDQLLRFDFESMVRIGAPGRDDQSVRESVPADQLFAWLSLGWIQLFGKEDFHDQVLKPFRDGQSPWLHTDLFPFYEGTIWLPVPRWPSKKTSLQPIDRKQYKDWVKWDAFFEAFFEDKAPTSRDTESPVQTVMLNNVAICRDKGEDNVPYYTAAVSVSTNAKAAQTETSFASIVRCIADGVEYKLEKVCQFMKDFGMGGGRSSGLGTITAVSLAPLPKSCSIPQAKSKRGVHVLLSPCCPTRAMLDEVMSSARGSNNYSISQRAGWLYDESGQATDIRKPTVRAFDTGGVFSVRPEGELVDVGTAQYPAFRYGIPFSIEA